ncbi:MAG: ATP-binding protein [Rhizobacter sp.]
MDLIEREPPLRELSSAVEQARQGRGSVALVFGEAGIGKTSIAQRLGADQPGVQVLWGGCEALFSPRPLGPLYDMADPMGHRVRELLGREGQRAELFAEVLGRLQHGERPTLMVFEDLHWADAATLDLVKFLARRIHSLRVLLLLSYRDDEIGGAHPLRAVLGDLPADRLLRVPLLPLSAAAVDELARRAGRQRPGLHASTGGNPFFVAEALRSEGLPATVRDAVLARAARLNPAARSLVDLAAIVPTRIEARLVEGLLQPTPQDVTAALSSGLLITDGRAYAFRHELARIAIEQALPAPIATSLHARMLVELQRPEHGELPLVRLVHHARGAGDGAAVLRYAPRAAERAASHGAHRESAALYAAALSHADGVAPAARADLLERRAYQCYLTDQIESAIGAHREALALWRQLGNRQQEGHALRWLSRLHWFLGRNREAETLAGEAVDLLQALPPDREYAWALSNRAQLHMLAGDTDEAVSWGQRAIEWGTALGDAEVVVHAQNNVGTALYGHGKAEGRALLEQSLRTALERGYGEHVARAYVNLVSTTAVNRDYAAARRLIDEAQAYFSARDLDAWVNYLSALQCVVDFEQGRWDAAGLTASRLTTIAGVAPISRVPALVVLSRLRLRRGDPAPMAPLEQATALARTTGELQRLAPVAAAHAEACWLGHDGDLDLVRAVYARAVECRSARALGELGYWLEVLGDELPAAPEPERPYRMQRDGDWRGAAAAWRELGCPYEEALMLLSSRDDEAMREALQRLESLQASQAVQRCREVLRLHGVRGVARGPRASTAANPAGLTQREMQILALLAQGLTNAEIGGRIVRSTKTVDHHVSAILGKLEVRSRTEAGMAAMRLGLLKHR